MRIPISVAYGSDIDQVRSLLMEISDSSENICKDEDQGPRVRFRSFGDSGISFELLFWIDKPANRGLIVDEINSTIYKRFMDESIEIPYPQRTLHLKTSDSLNISK